MNRDSNLKSDISALWMPWRALVAVAFIVVLPTFNAKAETPEEWVQLGERIHGGFGSYIALGIRLGLDAREHLHAGPRELDVTLVEGPASPCPCLADGLMLATAATPGRGTLQVATERAAWDQLAVVIVRKRSSGETLRYLIPDTARAKLDAMNRDMSPVERYTAMMAEPEAHLFTREFVDSSLPDWVYRH